MPEVKKVPVTVIHKKSKTIHVPVTHNETRYKTEIRKQLRTRYRTVHDTHTVPYEISNCACYQQTCGCIGQVGCGCCYPTCACAPRVQLSTQIVPRSVPETFEVKEVVKVPFTHKVTNIVPKIVVEDVPHTYHKTVVENKKVEVQVPVYKTVPKTTSVLTTVRECWEEQVAVDKAAPAVLTALRPDGTRVQLASETIVDGQVVSHTPLYVGSTSVLSGHPYVWNNGYYTTGYGGYYAGDGFFTTYYP